MHYSISCGTLLLSQSDLTSQLQLRDVARGLAFLHERAIVHGDMRPVHVFVTPHGRALLSGFATRLELPTPAPSGERGLPSWATSESDDPEQDWPPELPEDIDLSRYGGWGLRQDDRDISLEGTVEPALQEQASASLRSHSLEGDLFAFAILLIEVVLLYCVDSTTLSGIYAFGRGQLQTARVPLRISQKSWLNLATTSSSAQRFGRKSS
ncbi:hypothetical protein EXIGLDRAFT_695410 [Exidia glandulosa HHB12029]|uniref:Protein kinase domain-containing protein n=1 Tax=Exidia glandulosa HHB12029 TaxID=1314781 RepID=A0A165FVH5_EXIGL|nr:hypothetical protein EXIGLDRAFT_695410 [Exidia glandulosa HHB12029]